MKDDLSHTPTSPSFSSELKNQMGVEIIPESPEELEFEIKNGDKENSRTWWAEMWLRVYEKAKSLGKRIVLKRQNVN